MIKDPNAAREAQKYENPIPSREYILSILDKSKGPLNFDAITEQLQLTDDTALEALRRRLKAMERDGQIVCNRKGAYGKLDKMDLYRGRVQAHRDGYGFVLLEGSDDIYLSNRQMRRVFDGDEVLVRIVGRSFKGKKEGAIVEIIARNTQQIVGRFVADRGVHHVRPDNPRIIQDIFIPPDQVGDAKTGQFVVVDIIEYPGRDTVAKGAVAEVLGEHLAPGMEIDVAIRNHGIPHEWPQGVLSEAAKLPKEVAEKDKTKRFDIRHLPLVTIDGEDARDFDDAVFCERKKSGGWRLYVAIADVSHYVRVNSELDREAIQRGNSVYFPDFVVPMLPEALSNGLCSLNPNVDRLCMVCEMTVSARGKLSGYKFYEAVMHSHARLTYTQVGQILEERSDKRSGIRKQFNHVVPHLDCLQDLYKAFRQQRKERGAIDFETQETRILFDAYRKIERIVPVERNDAHKLIEECMLAANVCAAKFMQQHKIPALYRVHEGPREQKLELLREYLGSLGLGLPNSLEITPQDYQQILQSVADRPDAHLIQTVMLRSMNQAVYTPDNNGHFGLAYEEYAHFTSPIRRYPDLLIHRAIRWVIRSDQESNKVKRFEGAKTLRQALIYPYDDEAMVLLGEQCSVTERRADDATRDVVSWLKCEYLQDRVGEVFPGVVASVTSFGLFVELSDLYVEGLIHVTSLPEDYYHHDPAQHRLVGERTRKTFTLGDSLQVRVVRVNLDERKVDFELASGAVNPRSKVKASSKAKSLAKEYEDQQEKIARTKKRSKKRKVAEEAPKNSGSKKKKSKLKKKSGTKKKTKEKKPKV